MSIKIEMEKDPEEILEILGENSEAEIQKLLTKDIKEEICKIDTMSLESEEVLEDNSILLTINVA